MEKIEMPVEVARKLAQSLETSGKVEMSLKAQRLQILKGMKEAGVPFKKIRDSFVTIHRIAGISQKIYVAGKKPKYRSYKEALALKEMWAHNVRRFTTWANKEFKDYGVVKGSKEANPVDEKAKNLKKLLNAWTVIENALMDTEDTVLRGHLMALKGAMKMLERG